MRFFSGFLYKSIFYRYTYELHRQVDAIQMGSHNICIYEEVDKKYTGCILKTMESLDCALIGVCAVIRSNTVTQMHFATPTFARCSVPLKGQTRDTFNRLFFPCWCTTWSFPTICNKVFFPCWCVPGSSFISCALQISYFNFAMTSKQNDQGYGIMKLYDFTFIS